MFNHLRSSSIQRRVEVGLGCYRFQVLQCFMLFIHRRRIVSACAISSSNLHSYSNQRFETLPYLIRGVQYIVSTQHIVLSLHFFNDSYSSSDFWYGTHGKNYDFPSTIHCKSNMSRARRPLDQVFGLLQYGRISRFGMSSLHPAVLDLLRFMATNFDHLRGNDELSSKADRDR